MTSPPVGIVIPHWGSVKILLRCLRSVKGATHQPRQILVVNNDPRVDLFKAVKPAFPDVWVLQNQGNLGFAGACNQGLELFFSRDYPYALLLNNDAVVDRRFLEPAIAVMRRRRSLAAVSPRVLRFPGPDQEYPVPWFTQGRLSQLKRWVPARPPFWEAQALTGTCMLIRRKAFSDVGPLAEDYFMYCEELDWCIRARKNGWGLGHVPDSIVWHDSMKAPGKRRRLEQIAYYRGRSILALAERHPDWAGRGYLFKELVGDLRHSGSRRSFSRYAAAIRRGVADCRSGRLESPQRAPGRFLHSQFEEERHITDYFRGRRGAFLDIGANDGRTDSNTYRLAQLGWRGICVEPSPTAFRRLRRTHGKNPGIRLARCAVGPRDGRMDFYDFGNGLSCAALHFRAEGFLKNVRPPATIRVPALSVRTLLGRFPEFKIYDFISIDTEGMDLEILRQIPLGELGVRMLCVECPKPLRKGVLAYLGRFGFKRVYESFSNLLAARNLDF